METFILAAGLGTRLRPYTEKHPKALFPVGGKPLLLHTIERLVENGATEAVVNVHHFGQQIIDYIDSREWPIPIRVSDERECLLNTGGGIRKALPFFHETSPFLIHNVDIFSNANLRDFCVNNQHHNATLMVSKRQSTRQLVVRGNRLVGWKNLTTGATRGEVNGDEYAFSGIHLLSPDFARSTMRDFPQEFSIMDYYLDICQREHIHVDILPELQLLDVGKVDSIQQAERFLRD